MKIKSHELSELAARYINTTNRNIFLTGKAGTGKTTFLKYIKENTYKNTAIAAPTGIAAINAGGVTLHSLLHLPFGAYVPRDSNLSLLDSITQINTPSSVVSNAKFNATKRTLLRELELLIIDEVSMLRSDLLDCIDTTLRYVRRRKNVPFGGVQILFIGDLFQLPPVVKETEWQYLRDHYQTSYFFDSEVLRNDPPLYIEFEKIFRQSDNDFIQILNRLRNNEQTREDLRVINSYYSRDATSKMQEGFVFITTHNHKANQINEAQLDKIAEPAKIYEAIIEGEFPDNLYPLGEAMELKVGAQVMFVKNDAEVEKRYFNGKIGKVSELTSDKVSVRCDDDQVIELEQYQWEHKRYSLNKETNQVEERIIGTFAQFPLRLAWAITVHKSQGLTFERAILDLSGAFAPGQVYVALSRLIALEGLVLSAPLPENGFDLDTAITSFGANKALAENLQSGLRREGVLYLRGVVSNAFNLTPLLTRLSYHLQSFDKEETRSEKQQYLQWTKALVEKTWPVKETGVKFVRQALGILDTLSGQTDLLLERITKAKNYFSPLLVGLAEDIDQHIKLVRTRKKVKGYLNELEELHQLFARQNIHIIKAHLIVEAFVEGKSLTKTDLKAAIPVPAVKATAQTNKVPTREITFNMYKKAMSIDEIAKERNLVTSTIQGHLCHYVGSGQIAVSEFITSEKLSKILQVAREVDYQTGQIKSRLDSDYTYADIRFAMAHQQYQQSQKIQH